MNRSQPWTLLLGFCISLAMMSWGGRPLAADKFPPGWVPISRLDDQPTWSEFRDINDRIHLYLPSEEKPVRGVLACFVFHSGDPRELARLWNFALVTVPWPFEYDLGVNDKRNGRYKFGHPVGEMGVLLHYLQYAANETKHPELATVPIVGWLGQNGSHLCADLHERAADRVLARSDWASMSGRLSRQNLVAGSVAIRRRRNSRRECGLPAHTDRIAPVQKGRENAPPPLSQKSCQAS